MISKDVFTAAAVVALTSQSAWPQASAPGTAAAPAATAAPVTREQRKAETAAANRAR